MISATRYPTRRPSLLGAIKEPIFSTRAPVINQGGGTGGGFLPPVDTGGAGWSGGGTGTKATFTSVNLPGRSVIATWVPVAVGPTAGLSTNPNTPPLQTPAGAAISTVSGDASPLPTQTVVPAGGGASNTPVSTEAQATVLPAAPAKRWWPWVVGGVVVTAVGAYLFSHH